MTHEIRVSRFGLTTCPACLAHIRLAQDWAGTTCPFCSASLLGATRQGPRELMDVLRAVQRRTGGALAASLLSFGLAAGCETTDLEGLDAPLIRDAGETAVRDSGAADDSGVERDAGFATDAEVEDATIVDAGDVIPAPEYGKPPDLDAGVEDASVVDASEPMPTPLYGKIPAPTDGGFQPIDAGDSVDAGDS